MKDYLLDLIQHTHSFVDIVKVTGTDADTRITASSDDRTVIIYGNFKTPVTEFTGVFGMPNLTKLKTIVNFDDYDDDAIINIIRGTSSDPNAPAAIHFETKNGDFINDYRLMAKGIVEEKVKDVVFKGGNSWDIQFEPSIANIQRLKKQSQANSEESYFKTKTENGDLKIYFGDPSTHSGNFVFQSNVSGKLSRPWNWPVKTFLSIMDLPGDKMVHITDAGAIEITVDSGLSVWRYLLPGMK